MALWRAELTACWLSALPVVPDGGNSHQKAPPASVRLSSTLATFSPNSPPGIPCAAYASSRPMSKPLYQCLVFGNPSDNQLIAFSASFGDALHHFDLKSGTDYIIAVGITRDFVETVPTVAIFFGGAGTTLKEHAELVRLSIPIVPLVSSLKNVSAELPECLRAINALALVDSDTGLLKPAAVALQCLGLLPSQRRVFLSYRRDESREVALQLFETLSAKQFDVFLDTHSVAAAVDFQTMLWHRLCDADVVVMLDTPRYFDSRWTKVEWGRAIDKHISILQVIWPGHSVSRFARLAMPLPLQAGDLEGSRLTDATIERVALAVEALRSKSIALRHANIAGGLRSAVEELGGSVAGHGPRRSIVLTLPSGAPLVAYPSVGVPTAVTLHEAVYDGDARPVAVVYDHVGLSDHWMTHLEWLGTSFTSVRWLRSREVGWDLANLAEL